ncbi:MAG: recombination protein RecR [Bacteroidota bacterium]|nr:recombination protein RecR [Bacteroidota bacterium]
MIYTSDSIEKAVDIFSSLPTIGRKTAQRLTYYMLRQPKDYIEKFSKALLELKENVGFCSSCFNYTEIDPCPVCASEKRDRSTICVVEEPNEVLAVEKTNEYFGLYHVLHGVINPLDGIGPEDLKIRELIARLDGVNEVILALNPSVEGEVTTQYLSRLIKPLSIKITRIARGVPVGATLEFTDEATLSRAIEGRVEI